MLLTLLLLDLPARGLGPSRKTPLRFSAFSDHQIAAASVCTFIRQWMWYRARSRSAVHSERRARSARAAA
jgi:hypothetical protein